MKAIPYLRATLFHLALLLFFPLDAQFQTLRPLPRETFRVVSKNNTPDANSTATETGAIKAVDTERTTSPLQGFSLPLDFPIVLNSGYGYRRDPITGKKKFHHGIDLKAQASTVLSMLGGTVKKTGYERKGLGNYVTMLYGDFELTYGHLSSIFVSPKEVIPPGHPLGISGSTGRSTGDHLHLSLKLKGKKVDPLPFLLFVQRRVQTNKS